MTDITYLEAIREALFEEMERDRNVFCMGEDIGAFGGAFKVTEGLLAKFGEQRVIDSPISEIAPSSLWVMKKCATTKSMALINKKTAAHMAALNHGCWPG